ncbi:MAG: phosphoribosyltransferase [Dehalococcoidia bacterium]|nr:phosphoribosyltransferase [Dehalococcoidia bacterium]
MRLFRDRDDAGRQLAEVVARRHLPDPVVLGVPRGGVPVAAHVARRLGAPLGVVTARKLRAPGSPELAVGAVTAAGVPWVNDEVAQATGATAAYIEREAELQAAEAARRESAFNGVHRPDIRGKSVIVVDDGIATGATVLAAARSLKASGAGRVVIAAPVAPPDTIEELAAEADEVICPFAIEEFYAIGQFYEDFTQVGDGEVARVLREYAAEHAAGRATASR